MYIPQFFTPKTIERPGIEDFVLPYIPHVEMS